MHTKKNAFLSSLEQNALILQTLFGAWSAPYSLCDKDPLDILHALSERTGSDMGHQLKNTIKNNLEQPSSTLSCCSSLGYQAKSAYYCDKPFWHLKYI